MDKANICAHSICFLSLVIFLIAYFLHNEGLEWLCMGVFIGSGILIAVINPITEDDEDLFEEDEEDE